MAAEKDMIDACMASDIFWHHFSPDDWRFHVGIHTQRVWRTLNFNQRLAIAMDAAELARKMVEV